MAAPTSFWVTVPPLWCSCSDRNAEGNPSRKTRRNGFFFGGPTEFAELLEAWRADGKLEGLIAR